jgi:hypothetical protein
MAIWVSRDTPRASSRARDVGAADQQQELDCDAEHEEKPFRSSVQIGEVLPPQWDQAEGPAAADLRELLLQPARELLQLGRARLVGHLDVRIVERKSNA